MIVKKVHINHLASLIDLVLLHVDKPAGWLAQTLLAQCLRLFLRKDVGPANRGRATRPGRGALQSYRPAPAAIWVSSRLSSIENRR